MFPCTLEQFRDRVSKYEYLGRREDSELQERLDSARSIIEVACPQAADGALSDRIGRAAATLHSDYALVLLRKEVERDERGAPPEGLAIEERSLRDRLKDLAHAAQVEGSATPGVRGTGGFQVAHMQSLGDAPLPGQRHNDGILGGGNGNWSENLS